MNSQELVNLVREQGIDIFERMFRAVELVQQRLNRACEALRQAQVPYAVVGGNAVAAWVATIDEGAVRNTRDVDLLLEEEDLPRATQALQAAGFVRDEVLGTVVFLDGPDGKPSQGLHILIAQRKVRPEYASHPKCRAIGGNTSQADCEARSFGRNETQQLSRQGQNPLAGHDSNRTDRYELDKSISRPTCSETASNPRRS